MRSIVSSDHGAIEGKKLSEQPRLPLGGDAEASKRDVCGLEHSSVSHWDHCSPARKPRISSAVTAFSVTKTNRRFYPGIYKLLS
jgi:hypothetical protein